MNDELEKINIEVVKTHGPTKKRFADYLST
jgi:hypothetical protein